MGTRPRTAIRPHESRLGAVGVHHVRAARADDPARGGHLTGQPGPGGTGDGPVVDLGARGRRPEGERAAGRAGHHGSQPGPGLGPDEIGDDPGHSAVHGLNQMKDRQLAFFSKTHVQHARLSSLNPVSKAEVHFGRVVAKSCA